MPGHVPVLPEFLVMLAIYNGSIVILFELFYSKVVAFSGHFFDYFVLSTGYVHNATARLFRRDCRLTTRFYLHIESAVTVPIVAGPTNAKPMWIRYE